MNINYTAKLIVHGLPTLSKNNRSILVKWLRELAKEINKEDPKVFNKVCRFKLMK